MLDEKVPSWCLTNCLVDIGEVSLRVNWDLLNPRAINLYSSIWDKVIIRNRNNTGSMISHCLRPNVKSL